MRDGGDPEWDVVVQKEPRSRRVEDDVVEVGVLGASGLATPLTWDENSSSFAGDGAGVARAGVQVPRENVAMVDAQREPPRSGSPYNDMDWIDDDEEDDDEGDVVFDRDDPGYVVYSNPAHPVVR